MNFLLADAVVLTRDQPACHRAAKGSCAAAGAPAVDAPEACLLLQGLYYGWSNITSSTMASQGQTSWRTKRQRQQQQQHGKSLQRQSQQLGRGCGLAYDMNGAQMEPPDDSCPHFPVPNTWRSADAASCGASQAIPCSFHIALPRSAPSQARYHHPPYLCCHFPNSGWGGPHNAAYCVVLRTHLHTNTTALLSFSGAADTARSTPPFYRCWWPCEVSKRLKPIAWRVPTVRRPATATRRILTHHVLLFRRPSLPV